MSIDNVETMDQIRGVSKLNGWFGLRWYDPRLTWNPEDWAGLVLL